MAACEKGIPKIMGGGWLSYSVRDAMHHDARTDGWAAAVMKWRNLMLAESQSWSRPWHCSKSFSSNTSMALSWHANWYKSVGSSPQYCCISWSG